MPNLIATGKAPHNHWEKVIPHRPVTLGRLATESEWVVDWDVQISRKHATLEWRENRLLVRREPTARNPISYQDQLADEFTVGVGEQFFIGTTKFELSEDQPTLVQSDSSSVTKAWFDPADLQQVKFSDAETRIEILAALPGIIRTAPSVEELQSRVLDVLLDGVAQADSAAVVRVDLGTDEGEPAIEVLCERSRTKGMEALSPSRSLITDATQRVRRSILHVWQPGSLETGDAPDQSFDWAICSPLPDEPSPGIALYLCGRFETNPLTLAGVDPKVKLKPDIKFTELVADIFGSLLQVLNLQRREAQFSLLLSAQIREALVGRDMETVLSPRETDVTVLFCDLRGSSRVADDHESELMLVWEHVSSFLGIMTASISDQGGVIGDFQGDAAMGFWGWPKTDGVHAGRAAQSRPHHPQEVPDGSPAEKSQPCRLPVRYRYRKRPRDRRPTGRLRASQGRRLWPQGQSRVAARIHDQGPARSHPARRRHRRPDPPRDRQHPLGPASSSCPSPALRHGRGPHDL